ncbi:MAG: hypothetical protein RI947_1150 [Candidatus Parcubacteria bacterium]|jgi:hypothetical protein
MERFRKGFIFSGIKIVVCLALVLAAVSASGTVQAQRITMGPSPNLKPLDVIRNLSAGTFVVRYCNSDNGLADAKMTVSLTNNGNSVQAMSIANQIVPSGNGACASTSFPCTSFGTSCYEAKNFRVIIDTLGQIYESNETDNQIASFILNALPGTPTPVSMACVRNSANQIQVNLSWGNGGDTTTASVQIDDPSTATNPDHLKTGITALAYPVTYSYVNNAFAGKTLTGKVWGVNSLGNGPVANFSNATCPALLPPPTYTINAIATCSNEVKPTGRYRISYIIWPPSPADRIYESYATGTRTITKTLTEAPSSASVQAFYVALHSETANGLPINAMKPIGTPANSLMQYQVNWTEQHWNVRMPNTIPSGTYTIFYQAPEADCIATPFNKTGPVSGATLTPGSQTFSWSKYVGSGGFNQYLLTFKNSAGAVVLQRKISDINTTSTSINLWQSGDNPASGDIVSVKPPFALGAYTWQITAGAGGAASAAANNGTPWTFNMGQSAACNPQNLRFTCGFGGDPTKVQISWNTYGRPLHIQFDKNPPNTWYQPQNGDMLFVLPNSTYPTEITNVSIGSSTTSLVAKIATDIDYDWAVRDSATTTQSQYVAMCRSDILLKCPAQTACHTEGGLCGTGIAGSLGTCCSGFVCKTSTNPDQGGTCIAGRPTVTPTPGTTNCVCKSDNTCDTSCTYTKYSSGDLSNVSYANPIGCSLASVPFSSTPSQANKNAWCQRPLRTLGESDGNSSIDSKDYFYYVQAVAGGSLPSDSNNNVNPDFNGNGSVGTEDRIIIIKKLGGL